MGRILSQKEASLISKEEKEKGRRVVFTNGCFDIIHKGHIELLRQAKDRGDILIVGLNSDSSTKKIKKRGVLSLMKRRGQLYSRLLYMWIMW